MTSPADLERRHGPYRNVANRRTRLKRVIVAAVVAVAVAGLAVWVVVGETDKRTAARGIDLLLFSSGSRSLRVQSIGIDGSRRFVVISHPPAGRNDIWPVWSPDARRVAFVRGAVDYGRETEGANVWVVDADGRGERLLGAGWAPAWAPDGTSLVFETPAATEGNTIDFRRSAPLIVQRLGEDERRVVAVGSSPAWSPTGEAIAFLRHRLVGSRVDSSELLVVAPDGSAVRTLLDGVSFGAPEDGEDVQETYRRPMWSPDGQAIAVATDLLDSEAVSKGRWIRVVKLDGTTWRLPVTGSHGFDWSPDGRRIVSAQNEGLMVVDAVGGRPRTIVRVAYDLSAPEWAPDGRRIAFVRWTWRSVAHLYVAAANGATRRNLVTLRGYHWGAPATYQLAPPRWSPDLTP